MSTWTARLLLLPILNIAVVVSAAFTLMYPVALHLDLDGVALLWELPALRWSRSITLCSRGLVFGSCGLGLSLSLPLLLGLLLL